MIGKEAIVGMKVNHSKYGNGVIIDISDNGNIITVRFFIEIDGKKERKMDPSVLKVIPDYIEEDIQDNEKQEKPPIKAGDTVFHETYGEGIVLKKIGFFKWRVKFSNQIVDVLNDSISLIEKSILDEDDLIEENYDSAFKIIPSTYSEQDVYPTMVKRFLTFLRKNYDEGIATIKSYPDFDGYIGVLVVPKKGIIIFNLIETDYSIEALQDPLFEQLFKTKYNSLKKNYLDAFLNSKNFCRFIDGNNKILKYPLRFVYVFQNIDISRLSYSEKKRIAINNKNFLFKNFSSHFDNNELFSNFEKYDYYNFNEIDSSLYGSIMERVVPENTTLISIKIDKNKTEPAKFHNPKFYPITGKEREFSALCLDDYQIKTINDTKPGHYITLANPGTGKSVILVSKAYRIQSIKSDNHVLITCYNNNLAEHHNLFAKISGMKTSHLHISTFHKFIKDQLAEVDPNFVKLHPIDDDNKDFDIYVSRFKSFIEANPNVIKLNAIFIDEIQLFEPEWIDICYLMLDKENNKNYYFEMFGDINQDVKSLRSRGKASWQNTKLVPSLQGRVKKLDKNYRNTDLIANYLTGFITDFNNFLLKHGITVDQDSACLSSETMRQGSIKTTIVISGQSDVSRVMKTIKELTKKLKADYNDIAIIYPAKGYGRYYKPLSLLESALNEKNIHYSKIHGDMKTKLYSCDGVILSTIDSCLGLDFKYVILCGIHYWDFLHDENEDITKKLDKTKLLFDNNAKLNMCEIGKKIYSACSRARDGLFIIDDLDEQSPIKPIIRPTSGRSYYVER